MNYEIIEDKIEVIHFLLKFTVEGNFYEVNLSRLRKRLKLSDVPLNKREHIYGMVEHLNKKYYLYSDSSGFLFISININDYFKCKRKFLSFIMFNKVYFFGLMSYKRNNTKNLKNVYFNNKKCTEINRFSKIKFLRNLVSFSISLREIVMSTEIHNTLRIGNSYDFSVPVILFGKVKKNRMQYFVKKKYYDFYVLVRTAKNTMSLIITKVPYEKEYNKLNLIKNKLAKFHSKLLVGKNINLMFEKECLKASESGYYIFDKIMKEYPNNSNSSRTYFIIDKRSLDYDRVKKIHGKNIIEKYSYRHYLYIYASTYFISSELSNHVINPRLYIFDLNNTIMKKPLVFLQHGIMFSKPIDNPAARGFYKTNNNVNIYKSVISSELEAEQFYIAQYNRNDLINCGLPKFDVSFQDPKADKIVLMLTYRYWEEGDMLNSDNISSTTYYKAYYNIIDKFKEFGLIDRLLICCHPKFAKHLMNQFPDYADILENDVDKALGLAKIFITDYSSASYDAHFRGAYIIYDWSERDYLIENYQAIPPINESNCDGVPIFNHDDLIIEVNRAIEKNYIMDKKYQKRYMKINEFNDRKNGDRLVKELKKLNIL